MSAQLAADIVVNVLRHFLTEKKDDTPKEQVEEKVEQSNSPAALRAIKKALPPEPKKEEADE